MILKYITFILIVLSVQFGYSQSAQQPKFFGQCMLELTSHEEAQELTLSLRENPYVDIARVDWPTKRVFLLTKDISEFTESIFNSWLGLDASSASCIQVGLHGVDLVNPYPFTNCND